MPTSIENELISENVLGESDAASSPEALPLSFAQQRLWFFSQIEKNSALYNIPTALRLKGGLHFAALEKSLNYIVQRHEALRTNFISQNGDAVQVIRDNVNVTLTMIDLRNTDAKQREEKATAVLFQESQKPFDLAGDKLFRAKLIRLDEREHILFLNIHHIVSDEWSLRVLFQELSFFYNNFVKGERAQLPELSVQFADFALWQRDCLGHDAIKRDVDYWKQQLGKNFSPTELPLDHPRPAVQTYRGATISLSLPKNLLNSLAALNREDGGTLFMTLLAAFQALLHRWTGEEKITVGSPISGRNKIETESLIGFFVNTLVLSADVSGDMTFRDFQTKVRDATLSAYAHQELPFEKLVEELHLQRDAKNLSLLKVMFALQNAAENDLTLSEIESEILEIDTGTAKFDLTFVVRETKTSLTLVAEYNTELYEVETVERMMGQYGRLLEAVVADPGERISRLNLLSQAERQTLLIDWNQTSTSYPRDRSIPQLFVEQVEKTPDAIALVFDGEQLTYRQLDQRADQLAQLLRESGVKGDSPVGICLERSFELIVGLLAILKAGGAYVPLDVHLPEERLRSMLEDTAVALIITDQEFSFSNARKIHPKDFPESGGPRFEVQSSADSLAYVLFTSGSTGKPKGVAVPHRAVVRLVKETNFMSFDPGDVFLQFAPVSFDASTLEIWGALLNGAKLVIHPPHLPSLEELGRTLRENKISTLWLTAGLFHQMVEHQIESLRGVKQLLAGGDVLSVAQVKKVLAQLDGQLINGYGPTENTTFTCCYAVPKDWNGRSVPIGKPIANTQVYILDQYLEPVPTGVPGELFIGGDGLARGYLNAPSLTAQKFIPHPFQPGERLYKTGDQVRWLADGTIEFLGRLDHQIKLRGFRIEPAEIEHALNQHHAIHESLVVLRQENDDQQLVAYFVSKHNPPPTPAELRLFLKDKLPDYMVPAHLLHLTEFPLTLNGKLNRRALPIPDKITTHFETRTEPLSDLEKRLKQIWETVLARQSVGVRDNFFDLGGHSLLAVRLFAQMEKALGKKLPLSLLFQSPTIEQLAGSIAENTFSQTESSLVEIQPNGSRAPMFWLHTLGGGGGGGVLRYQKLAQLLGTDQPSYGLVAPQNPFMKIETMAAHYILEMRKVQPVGPYHVGGYCFGGVVALEIAQQLLAAGNEVALLAVLDTSPANVTGAQTFSTNAINLLSDLPQRARRLFRQDPKQISEQIGRKFKKLSRGVAKLFYRSDENGEGQNAELEDFIDMTSYPKGYEHFAKAHWKALINYFPKPYAGRVVLFESTQSPGHRAVELIWESLAQKHLEIKRIPCAHETMLTEPAVEILANELMACLQASPLDEEKACAA